MEKSMLDVAYDVVVENGNPISFKDLVAEVARRLEMSEEEVNRRISRFYTNISLDGRFITLGDNIWDLRNKHPFKCVHIDMNDVYSDTDENEEDDGRDDNESEVERGLGEKGKEDEFGFETEDEDEETESEEIF